MFHVKQSVRQLAAAFAQITAESQSQPAGGLLAEQLRPGTFHVEPKVINAAEQYWRQSVHSPKSLADLCG